MLIIDTNHANQVSASGQEFPLDLHQGDGTPVKNCYITLRPCLRQDRRRIKKATDDYNREQLAKDPTTPADQLKEYNTELMLFACLSWRGVVDQNKNVLPITAYTLELMCQLVPGLEGWMVLKDREMLSSLASQEEEELGNSDAAAISSPEGPAAA